MPMLHSPKVCEYRFRMLCKCCNPLHSPPKCKAHCKQKQCTHHPFLPFECIPSVAARFPCFLRNGCRTECLLHRAARNMPPGFRVFAGKPHGFRVQQVRCPHFRQSPPLLPHRTAAHTPCSSQTSGKRNSQLRKTAVARPPYKPRHGRHTDPRPRRNLLYRKMRNRIRIGKDKVRRLPLRR